jgi:hypothetical protein
MSEWGFFENAYNCKMTFTATTSLNGKVMVSLQAKGASVYIYMMPNNFNKEISDTVGILENNQI